MKSESGPGSSAGQPRDSGCDYVIIGGGSAGCLAAWRLIAETEARVVLLEIGAEY